MADPNNPNLLAEAVSYLSAALGAVLMWAWKHTHSLVKAKADAKSMDELVTRFETAFHDQREDNQRIFSAIEKVADDHSKFTQEAIRELGKRPTREECSQLFRHNP